MNRISGSPLFSLLLIATTAFLISAGGAPKLKMTKVAEGITVGLPADFFPMGDDDIANKYPSTKKPLAMYTYIDRTADFGVNLSKSLFPGSDPRVLLNAYKATIIDSYDKVDFIQSDTAIINNRIYTVFEYIGTFDNISTYNYLQYTIVKDNILIFNFSCPAKDQSKWQTTAKAMMATLRIYPKSLVLPEKKEAEPRGMTPQQTLEKQKQKQQQQKK